MKTSDVFFSTSTWLICSTQLKSLTRKVKSVARVQRADDQIVAAPAVWCEMV